MKYAMDCVQYDLTFDRVPMIWRNPPRRFHAHDNYASQWLAGGMHWKCQNVRWRIEVEVIAVNALDGGVVHQCQFEFGFAD